MVIEDGQEKTAEIIEKRRKKRQPRPRRCWVRTWLDRPRRSNYGHFYCLMPELKREDPASYNHFLRVSPEMFHELVQRLTPRITKKDTNWRKAIEPALKVAITLNHLASGTRYSQMKYKFRVPDNTISLIVTEVTKAIVDEYAEEVIQAPTTTQEWLDIAEQFEKKWNVPHAIGALDGKHVAMKKPHSSGSQYFNYKKFFSVVIMALVDADYKFIWIDMGGVGHQSDSQIFNESELAEHIEEGTIGIPEASFLPNDNRKKPYFILGDDVFALRTWMMKPYSDRYLSKEQRIYNYRISRGRRVSENAFGIMAQRWGVLLTTMHQNPNNVRRIVHACVCLHNLMRIRYGYLQNPSLDSEDANHNLVPGAWREAGMMRALKKTREYFLSRK